MDFSRRRLTLNVVVERAVAISVLIEESKSVVVSEIFKLNQSVLAIAFDNSSHELVNEVIVSCSRYARLSQSDVQRIFKQVLVVGADVNHDWQTLMRFDASEGSVECKFSNRDSCREESFQDLRKLNDANSTHPFPVLPNLPSREFSRRR